MKTFTLALLLKLYNAMGYGCKGRPFVWLGKKHHKGGNSGHVCQSGNNLHKLRLLSPWRRGGQSLVSAAQLWCTYSSWHWLSQDSSSSQKGTPLQGGTNYEVNNKVLRQLLIRHQSFEKLDFLQSNHHLMSAGDFQLLFNKWDKEIMQLMLALENVVISFRMEA